MLFEMKKLENLRLKGGVKVLTTSDMKMLKGGSVGCRCDSSGNVTIKKDCNECWSSCGNQPAICIG